MSNLHPGRVLPQDLVAPDGSGEMLSALPISQAEIEDLLYGDDRPVADRVQRLTEIAEFLREQESGDFGDNDPGVLAGEIEDAIARLSGDFDPEAPTGVDEGALDDDPLNHRETLSPDSDDFERLEAADEASLTDGTEPLDDRVVDGRV